jgi:hypothetical protein
MNHGLEEGCDLLPCSNCKRHVSCAPTCPFCGARIELSFKPFEFRIRSQLTRAQLFFVGAALTSAGFAISCGSSGALYGKTVIGGFGPYGEGGQGDQGGIVGGGAAGASAGTGGAAEAGNGGTTDSKPGGNGGVGGSAGSSSGAGGNAEAGNGGVGGEKPSGGAGGDKPSGGNGGQGGT